MRTVLYLSSLVSLLCFPAAANAQDVEQYFQTSCAPCHSIGGGRIVGPDLKGVLDRQDRQWLVEFIVDPDSKLDGGDPYAAAMLAEYNGVRMAPLGVDEILANSLLDYIASKSGPDAVVEEPEELVPFTAEDVERGRRWFTGATAFKYGAPACNSCHTTAGLGSWAGGRLGPDLTLASHRLGGRRALTGWLAMPGSATMAPVYLDRRLEPDEIHGLVAFLEAERQSGASEAGSPMVGFLLVGILTAAALLALFGFLWRGRYDATRVPMVKKTKR